ncbi:hypothetical protein [Brevundimonas sp. A19_0]|uniref:hypothetical protein n=1 Tax=Brevundimonas sp. A19_0 TaxID=2821087 RepID=UPI001ADC16AB|nr:hypothetical protein [Brevundimonas sp. A19_0]MBO9501077.1 hypothetical protein [Brevundimonas sp. A19_0]
MLDSPLVRLVQTFERDESGALKVNFELLALAGHLQDNGRTKVALRNAAVVYDYLNVAYCAAFADFDIGGYAWARLGAFPVDAEQCRLDLLKRLEAMAKRGGCTVAQKRELENLVRETPSEVLMYDLARTVDNGQALGKILLLGYKWDAIWRVTDEAQRARVIGALT